MRKPSMLRALIERLPLPFRVLYRHFVLRVVDIEALSVEADIAGFLGQFAGVLIMVSIVHAFVAVIYFLVVPVDQPAFAFRLAQYLISTTMLAAGLFGVISWDGAFPDRRDVFVLLPLPVAPRTLLLAKVAASSALLGGAIFALNVASGVLWPVALNEHGLLRAFAAYWITIFAAAIFLYSALLSVQGLGAYLFSRRVYLRFSAFLQLAAFGVFLGVYFLLPPIPSPEAMAAAQNHWRLVWWPCYWYFALFRQLNGSLPASLSWLAWWAWGSLGVAVLGAAASLLLCYSRTMRKTVEEPDLVPGAYGSYGSHGPRWRLRLGGRLQTAILLFCLRSLTRSRQHRVIFSFYIGAGLAIALLFARDDIGLAARPLSLGFLIATYVLMSFAVIGLRSTFTLPVSLAANWVLRTTQISPAAKYLAATRRSLLLFAVAPVWLGTAIYSFAFTPRWQAATHLAVLALFGSILVDINLLGFAKVPFTCSYLPGKSNAQFGFWVFLLLFIPLAMLGAHYELQMLGHVWQSLWLLAGLGAIACGLWAWNRHQAKSAVLYFDELPAEEILSLGLL
jgi:hypothetical protein